MNLLVNDCIRHLLLQLDPKSLYVLSLISSKVRLVLTDRKFQQTIERNHRIGIYNAREHTVTIMKPNGTVCYPIYHLRIADHEKVFSLNWLLGYVQYNLRGTILSRMYTDPRNNLLCMCYEYPEEGIREVWTPVSKEGTIEYHQSREMITTVYPDK